jgi:hypothetical protein
MGGRPILLVLKKIQKKTRTNVAILVQKVFQSGNSLFSLHFLTENSLKISIMQRECEFVYG